MRRKLNSATALTLRLEGLTYAEIGARLGVSRQRIQQILRPPAEVAELVKKRARGRCEDCKQLLAARGHIHHRSCDIARGLYNKLGNLSLLCKSCHMKRHPVEAGRRGQFWTRSDSPLGRYLAEHRLSQNRFAAICGVNQSTISKILSGSSKQLSLEVAQKIEWATRGAVRAESFLRSAA